MNMPQVFQFSGGMAAGIGIVILIVYHATGKKWEANIVKKKEELLSGTTGILECNDDNEEGNT